MERAKLFWDIFGRKKLMDEGEIEFHLEYHIFKMSK